MRVVWATIVLLGLAGLGWADQPVLTVPEKLDAKSGRIARIVVKADNATNVKWWCDGDADLFREYTADSISLCFVGDVGTYKVRVIASGNKGELSDPAVCVVTVGTPAPPTPPTPPTPPAPTDPLTTSLQAAYAAEPDAHKAAKKDLLESLYAVGGESTVNDPALKTTADLLAKMQGASKSLLADSDLPATRKAVAAYLNTKLPVSTQPLDAPTRQLIGQEFTNVATALGRVK